MGATTNAAIVSRTQVEGRLTELVAYAMAKLADRALAAGVSGGNFDKAEELLSHMSDDVPDDVTRLAREVLLHGIFGDPLESVAAPH